MKMLLQHKIQAGFAVALGFLLLTGASTWWSARQNVETFRRVNHTYEVLDALEDVLVNMLNIQTGNRGFAISGEEAFLQPYTAGIAALQKSIESAKALSQDNPNQQSQFTVLEPLIQQNLSHVNEAINLRRSGDTTGALQLIASGRGKATMDEIRKVIAEMENTENQLLQERTAKAQATARTTMAFVVFGSLLALGLVGLSSVLVRRDFEKRQQAEAERDRFFTLSLDLLCIAKTDGYFKRVNPAFTTTLGWSAEEILARPFLDFVHPDDRPATLREVEKLAVGQPTLHFENRYQCKDGSWKILAWRCNPQPDGTIYASARDVTKFKQMTAELEHEHYLLHTLMDNLPEHIYFKDREGRFLHNNLAHAKWFGLADATQAVGKTDFDFFSEEHARQAYEDEQTVIRTGQLLIKEEKETWPDGHVTWVLTTKLPFRDEHQQIVGTFGISHEVTKRKQMEEALRRSEESLAVTLHSIGDAVLTTDTEGRITRMNPVAEKLIGWTQAEALGRPVAEVFRIINEQTRQPSIIPVETVLATGEIHGLANHTILLARDGTERPIADSAAPIRDRDGRLLGVVLVFRDVTEEHAAEKALRASEEFNRSIVESGRDCFKVLSLEGRLLEMAAPGRKLMCVTDFEKIRNADWLSFWQRAEDREAAQGALAAARAGQTGHFQGFTPTLDGTAKWWDVILSPIMDAEGKVSRLLGVSRDITEQKCAEEEIRRFNVGLEELVHQRTSEMREALATLDASDDGAFIFDPETLRHTYVNEGAIRQLGYSRQELLGMTPVDCKPEFNEARYRELLAPMLRGDVRTHRFTTLHRHRDSHDIPVEINLQYVTPVGERPRFIAIVRDITERLKNERLARRSQRLEAVGTLAGGVAHDLNNALAPIMMGMELLRMQYPAESKVLDMFQASAQRGADMVRQLLNFAKGAEGERVSIQPDRLVKEMQNLMAVSFPKNLQLVVKCAPQLPTVLGDATQLHQVLLNLCVNARDAMPNGGTLTLEAQGVEVDAASASSVPDAKPGKYLALRVRDTGTGIPPEILDRIFDPFFTTKDAAKGTGLGLSTVMGIMKGHGGFLKVYSQPGQGSTFTAYLPADRSGSDTKHVTKPAVEFRGQGETILLVDDEPAVREMARVVLGRLNFKPLTATDGADGLIQAAEHQTELRAILTDLHMPHMDGLAFVRALRRMLPDIPVVVVSGRMEDALAGEFKTLGVTRRLDKPFTEAQLAAVLKSLLAPK